MGLGGRWRERGNIRVTIIDRSSSLSSSSRESSSINGRPYNYNISRYLFPLLTSSSRSSFLQDTFISFDKRCSLFNYVDKLREQRQSFIRLANKIGRTKFPFIREKSFVIISTNLSKVLPSVKVPRRR